MSEESLLNEFEKIKAYALLGAKEVFTLDDLCLYTGLSKSHVYKLTCSKQIPYYRPSGKLMYFDRRDIVDWLKQNRINSISEAESQAARYCYLKEQQPEAKTYLVRDINTGLVKIGKTRDIIKRISGLMTANPGIELIAYSEKDNEKVLHREYKDCHIFREWYHISDIKIQRIIDKYDFRVVQKDYKTLSE